MRRFWSKDDRRNELAHSYHCFCCLNFKYRSHHQLSCPPTWIRWYSHSKVHIAWNLSISMDPTFLSHELGMPRVLAYADRPSLSWLIVSNGPCRLRVSSWLTLGFFFPIFTLQCSLSPIPLHQRTKDDQCLSPRPPHSSLLPINVLFVPPYIRDQRPHGFESSPPSM